MTLTQITGEFVRPQTGRHVRRRPVHAVLLACGLVELTGAVGWLLGFGVSPSGLLGVTNAVVLIAIGWWAR